MTDDIPDGVLGCADLVAQLGDEGLAEGVEGCFAAFVGEQLFLQPSKPLSIRVTALVAPSSWLRKVILWDVLASNQALDREKCENRGILTTRKLAT